MSGEKSWHVFILWKKVGRIPSGLFIPATTCQTICSLSKKVLSVKCLTTFLHKDWNSSQKWWGDVFAYPIFEIAANHSLQIRQAYYLFLGKIAPGSEISGFTQYGDGNIEK
jgi:hypothetical protein